MEICHLPIEPLYEGMAIKKKQPEVQKTNNRRLTVWWGSVHISELTQCHLCRIPEHSHLPLGIELTLQVPIIWDSGSHQYLPCLASTVRDLFGTSNDDKLTQRVPEAVNNGPSGPSSDDSEPKQHSQCILYKKQGVSPDD